ncbi:MAG: hypothetical protein M3Y87_07520 [Myxococcota bacterium]|nr:hypothetical protein [Myxococcota bacterium]
MRHSILSLARPLAVTSTALALVALASVGCTTGTPASDDAGGDGGSQVVQLVLDPPSVELSSIDGSMPSVTFRAYATMLDGQRVEVTPDRWTLAHDRLGAIDESGTFLVSGRAGGTVELVASMPGAITRIEGRASISVNVDLTLPAHPSVPPSVIDRFGTLPESDDPFAAATILYPLEGARMPNNVAPPVVQWHPRESGGDGFRITLTAPHAAVRGFAYDDGRTFQSSWPIDASAWRIVADSARSEEIEIRVDRLPSSAEAIVPGNPVRIWLSEDGVFGTLYYWEVRTDPQASDVLRIDAATGARQSVFGTSDGACVGCHALSHDGRRLAATLDSRGTSWVTALVDTATATEPPPDLIAPLSPAYHFLSFSPDDTRILASRAEGADGASATRLVLLDGASGEEIPATGLPTGDAGYPAWSPDGGWVAWMDGGGDGPRGTDTATRITIAPVGEGDAFGATRVLHDGASLEDTLEGGSTDSRPTWSPDARFVAFAHGTRSVSASDISGVPPRAAIYLVPRDGGDAIRLERGMGRDGPVDAFWPVFSPFSTEEADGTRLYWLAFYSRQDYGNARAGTRGSERRQLWVMAIDPELAAAGEDPSSPPYWLPGQDVLADDIAAQWAPTSCRGRDETCSASSECCSGECAAADPSMPDVLTCRPPIACRRGGESCEDASDCCGGLACNLGVCGYVPPI